MPVDVGGIKIGGEHVIRENLFRHYTCLDPNSPGGNTTWNDISGNNQDDIQGALFDIEIDFNVEFEDVKRTYTISKPSTF